MKNDKKDFQIHFMVSEHERSLIEQNMQQAGIRSMGAYLRKIAINGYIVQLDLSDIRKLNTLLGNVANNLNQYARRAHETRNIYEADIRDLQEKYDNLWDLAKGILRELSKLNDL